MTEPKCYRCAHHVSIDATYRVKGAVVGGERIYRCARGYAHEFPHIGCEEFDSEAGTDWAETQEVNGNG